VIALVRYLIADIVRSQRYLAALLAYCAVLAMLYTGDAGASLPAYAGSCALIFPVAAWFAVVFASAEDPVQRTVTVVAAGGWTRVLSAVAALTVVVVAALALLATLWPVLTNPHPYTVLDVVVGYAAHLVCGLNGAGLGLLLARPVIARSGYTFLWVTAVVVATFAVGRATPIGVVLGFLADQRVSVPALAFSGIFAVVLLVAAVALGRRIAPRRG
jgi:hypothetical protein